MKVRGWRNIYGYGSQKKAGVAILISDKLKFKLKTVVIDKEGHYIILKGSIHQEDLTIVNIYALNRSSQLHKTTINQDSYVDMNTLIVGDLNTSLSVRESRKSIKK